jgi:hypothetical protein
MWRLLPGGASTRWAYRYTRYTSIPDLTRDSIGLDTCCPGLAGDAMLWRSVPRIVDGDICTPYSAKRGALQATWNES